MKIEKNPFLLIIGFLLLSCESKEPWELLIDENISKINGDIQVTEIDLDLFENTHAEPDVVISPDTSVIIGMPRDLFVLNDSFYLLDQAQNSVFVIDNEGTVIQKIDKAGREPGESTRATSMATNGEFIFMFSLQDNAYQLAGSRTVEHPDGGGAGIRPIIYEDRMYIVYENYPDILVYDLAGLFSG